MKIVQTAYLITMPDVGSTPFNFKFTASTKAGNFGLQYTWDTIRGIWLLWVTLPDGTSRQVGVFQNTLSWGGYLDFGFYVESGIPHIGQADLANIGQFLIVWGNQ